MSRWCRLVLVSTACLALGCAASLDTPTGATFEVTFPASLHEGPLDGRLYLMVSAREYDGSPATEPRSLVANWSGGEPLFAIDVEN